MGFGALLGEELRALPRGRFTLPGVGVLFILIALTAATAGTFGTNAEGFLLPVFGFVPMLLLPIMSVQFAQARASGFLRGVFTAPVTETRYFLAKLATGLAVGLAYVACASLFLVIQAVHLGPSTEGWKYLLLGAGMVVYATVLGILVGVLFTKHGALASLATATAVMVGSVAAMLAVEPVFLLPPGGARTVLLHAMHASGGLLLQDALGLGANLRSASPSSSAAGFAISCGGALLLAWWVFSRRQSVEGWEVRGTKAAAVAVLLALLVATPSVVAKVEYEPVPPPAPPRSLGGDSLHLRVAPVDGLPPRPPHMFAPDVIPAGRSGEVHLLVFLYPHPDAEEPYRNVSIRLTGLDLTVEPDEFFLEEASSLPRLRPREFGSDEWPYLRLAVTMTPSAPTALRGNSHMLTANVTYQAHDAERVFTADSTVIIHSEVPHAALHMGLAGTPVALAAFAGFAIRRWRMR